MKDKSFKILFGVYFIMFAADLITTLNTGELLQYLEANPLFRLGGLPLIVLFNILFMGIWWWLYSKGSITTRFIVVFSLVAIITTRIIAITNNIAIAQNPPTIEQAMAVTQQMKTETITRLAAVNLLPFFNTIIAWLFFKPDHNITRRENE